MPQIAFQSSCARPTPRLSRNPLGRLTDHLDIADDGVLQFLRRHERPSAGPDETGDPLATLEHVVQV